MLTCSGFYHKCTDGEQRFFVPTLAAYVGDIKEINDVMGIQPHPAFYSDIRTLAHSQHFNKPEYQAEARTESKMLMVRDVFCLCGCL